MGNSLVGKRAVLVAVGSAVGSVVGLGSAAHAAVADPLGAPGNVTGVACSTANGVSGLANGVSIQGKSPQSVHGGQLASGVTGAVKTLCAVANPPAAAQRPNPAQQAAAQGSAMGVPLIGGLPIG